MSDLEVKPLVVTPSPFPTESLRGYILRVSEANGYSTPRYIACAAGSNGKGMFWGGGFRVEDLAVIVNKPPDMLSPLFHINQMADSQSECYLLGQRINRRDARLTRVALCPMCVKERGFLEAHWDLAFVFACPRHRCKLLTECPKCGQRLSWVRPGLLRCRCKADLSDVVTAAVSDSTVDLIAIISANVLHETSVESTCGLPVTDLLRMPLHSLLSVVGKLGKQNLRSRGMAITSNPAVLVEMAAEVLSNWPRNYFELLRRLDARMEGQRATCGLSLVFESLCNALFYNKRLSSDVAFLREQFLRFGLDEWDKGTVNREDLKQLVPDALHRFISLKDFSRRLETKPETIWKLVDKGYLTVKEITVGGNKRVIVDTATVLLRDAPGKTFRENDAAAFVGLSRTTLSQLRTMGVYQVNHLPRPYFSYHELDLQAFVARLMERCPDTIPVDKGNKYISLGAVMQRKFNSGKGMADLIQSYLAGGIKAVGRESNSVRGILFIREEINRIVMDTRSAVEGHTHSKEEVAAALQCHQETVPNLIKEGYLAVVPGIRHPRITRQSIEAFDSKYITLGRVATEWGTTAEKLKRIGERAGLSILTVDRSHSPSPQAFLLRKDLPSLVQLFSKGSKTVANILGF